MSFRYRAFLAPVLLLGGGLLASPAFAADEEIQVYMDEMGAPGEVGLDVHVNDVMQGDATPDYAGQEQGLHRWRITPEFSLGLPHGFELGAYLPLATVAPDGVLRVSGVKGRLKWLAPHGDTGFFWGANFELGRVAYRLDQNPWNGEMKLIGGWRRGRWTLAANGNFDFAVSGPAKGPATFELATKAAYRLTDRLALGMESYNGMGALRDPGHLGRNDHQTFLVADATLGRWDVNAGIGHGYGSNPDHLILKFVIGVPIGKSVAK